MNYKNSKIVLWFETASLDYFIPLIVLAAAAIPLYFKAVAMAWQSGDTQATFYALADGMQQYYEFKTPWRPRMFSTGLAALLVQASENHFAGKYVFGASYPLGLAVGIWTAGWFVLTGLPVILMTKRRSLFYILGIFAAVLFGYMDVSIYQIDLRFYPWDMPSLFIYVMFVLLFVKQNYKWMLLIILIGVGFKETAIILCIGYLFADMPWRQRIAMLVWSVALSLGVKIALDFYVRAPLFLTMETVANNEYHRYHLIDNLFLFRKVIPLFVNAGLLLAFYVVPASGNKNIIALKIISIPFFLGQMLFGGVIEYRIWFEMIPFALYALDLKIYGDPFLAGKQSIRIYTT